MTEENGIPWPTPPQAVFDVKLLMKSRKLVGKLLRESGYRTYATHGLNNTEYFFPSSPLTRLPHNTDDVLLMSTLHDLGQSIVHKLNVGAALNSLSLNNPAIRLCHIVVENDGYEDGEPFINVAIVIDSQGVVMGKAEEHELYISDGKTSEELAQDITHHLANKARSLAIILQTIPGVICEVFVAEPDTIKQESPEGPVIIGRRRF